MKKSIKIINRRVRAAAIVLFIGIAALTACSPAAGNFADNRTATNAATPKISGEKTTVKTPPANDATAANKVPADEKTADEKAARGCPLTKAPAIKGFALGQTVEEIDRRFPGFQAAYERAKETETAQNKKTNFVLITSGSPALDKTGLNGKEFEDFSFIWHFLDGKLIGLVVKDLSEANADLSIAEFLSEAVGKYGLPNDGWKIGKEDDADLTCQGFNVALTAGGQPGMSVMIFDAAGEKEKEKREL